MGIFVQDEWRLKPNFVLSYGLRYENETILIDKNDFGPRCVFLDPFKSGKTVIRGGVGIFYSRPCCARLTISLWERKNFSLTPMRESIRQPENK